MTDNELWCRVTVMGRGGTAVATWPFLGVGRPDLTAVDRLARLQLAAVRVGGGVRLSDVSTELDALLRLVGLGRELGREPEGGEDPPDVEE
jgi:hypothetical protein